MTSTTAETTRRGGRSPSVVRTQSGGESSTATGSGTGFSSFREKMARALSPNRSAHEESLDLGLAGMRKPSFTDGE
ncbi:hypothetical protein IAU59_005327 [Kwoniella sp. CBS 9459]